MSFLLSCLSFKKLIFWTRTCLLYISLKFQRTDRFTLDAKADTKVMQNFIFAKHLTFIFKINF